MTWQQDFIKNGYAVFPKLVPQHLVAAALDAVTEDLRTHYDPDQWQDYDSRSYCPTLRRAPVIMDLLFKSPVWDLLEEALGMDKLVPIGGAQIAIRQKHNDDKESILPYHLDGVPDGLNGVEGNAIDNFTALIGIFLTDIARPYGGNLVVWPGSHRVIENYFREKGPEGMLMSTPQVDPGEPKLIDASAGDVVLCHYQLLHGMASNTTDRDRIAVYFRSEFKDIGQRRYELLTHMWRGWKIAPPSESGDF